MDKDKRSGIWQAIVFLVIGCVTVAVIAEIARRISSGSASGSVIDLCYNYIQRHVWEFLATLSLCLGIWFSLVRRRIYVSLVLMLICFLCAFVFPFLHF